MDIGSLYNVLIGAMAKQANADTAIPINRNIVNNISFGDILASVSNHETVSAKDMFSVAFSDYNVNVKSGDCSVPSSCWDRKDFPAWKYFQDDTSADCLNQWRPRGTPPTGAEAPIQSALSQIEYGSMAVIIPDELREKMEADPEYAWEIAEKVQKYKEDYDRKDNALAVSYGENPTLYQMTKRYCFSLDEKGDVETCWVVSGGMDTRQSSDAQGPTITKSKNNQQDQQVQRHFASASRRYGKVQTMPIDALSLLATNTDYLNMASYFAPPYVSNYNLKNLGLNRSNPFDNFGLYDL